MVYKCNNELYTAAIPVQSNCLMLCLLESVKILYREFRICFPEHCHYYSMVCLWATFCTFFLQDQQQKAFFTSGSSLQQLREVFKEKKMLSHSETLENCNQAVVFILSYVLYSPFSSYFYYLLSIFVFHLFLFIFIILFYYSYSYLTLFFIIGNQHLSTFTNVSDSQPLSSTCTDTKCQPLSSVTTFVNYSLLEMSMSKPQWEGTDSWKAESKTPFNPLWRSNVEFWSPHIEKSV